MKYACHKKPITIICLLAVSAGIIGCFTYRTVQQDRLNHKLINAIKTNNSRSVRRLLLEGADPNARDNNINNLTATQFVFRIFRQMRHESPKTRPNALLTALQAWWKPNGGSDRPPENIIIVKSLLNKQVDVNCQDADGDTPLIEASISEREDVVRLLLNKGADVNAKDKYGYTAFDYVNGQHQHPYSESIMRLLKQAGTK